MSNPVRTLSLYDGDELLGHFEEAQVAWLIEQMERSPSPGKDSLCDELRSWLNGSSDGNAA